MFQVGDKIMAKTGEFKGVVFLVDEGQELVGIVSYAGITRIADANSLTLVATARYLPNISIGDLVVLPDDEECKGVVFAVQPANSLPIYVGWDDGTSYTYSSKELRVVAKATYEKVEHHSECAQ